MAPRLGYFFFGWFFFGLFFLLFFLVISIFFGVFFWLYIYVYISCDTVFDLKAERKSCLFFFGCMVVWK